MGKAVWFGIGVALLAAGPAAAIVPVSLQQRAQLRAIIDMPALVDFFPIDRIDRIERIARSLWRVTAGRCHIDVRMVPMRRPYIGLTGPRYEPVAERRQCGRQGS
jgi:hypothetical protein